MKKLITACLFTFPAFVQAQKVDLDPFKFTVQYRQLPAMRIDSTYNTYNVVVEGSKIMQPFLIDLTPAQTVLLEGWKKLPQTGHITIKIVLDDLLPEAVSVAERVETIRNKAGQVTATNTYYSQEVKYSFAATAMVSDYKGAHIIDFNLADRGMKNIYRSPEFALRTLADGYFILNTFRIKADLYRQNISNSMHLLSQQLTENFGYKVVNSNDVMWIVDSRKHSEYSAHRQAFQQLTDVFFGMSADNSIDAVKVKVQPVIEYFERIKKDYTSSSKHDRKLRYASYYNLAVLYYYLDNPQAMMKEAQGLRLNDYDSKDARGFENSAILLKNLFEKLNIYTRHFKIDVTSYKGPFEKKEVAIKYPEKAETDRPAGITKKTKTKRN